MQRAASRTPRGRHRRPKRPDRVLLGLKIGTFLVLAGLIGTIVLLTIGGPENRPVADRSPAVPRITPSPGDDASVSPAPPTESAAVIEAPELQTRTADIVATPPPTSSSTPTPTQPSQPPAFQFAVIGERCDNPGAFSITREREPVMCYRSSRGSQPRWRRID